MKAMTRQQIAYYAGVSVKTLNNWCKPYREELRAMGMTRSMVVWRCRRVSTRRSALSVLVRRKSRASLSEGERWPREESCWSMSW